MPHHGAGRDYWGYLIQSDKQPTPLFRSLLLGISHYVIKQVAPWEVKSLTPIKLANFYRLCGGSLDGFFLDTPDSTLAFIYKSMGCYHSLQPTKDPFAAPCIPALTNDGFVKWQTIQVLLCPDEHVPFLQEALKRFEIKNPYDGELFPRSLPADSLPRRPDPDMTRWHDQVGQQLLREGETSKQQQRTQQLPSSRGQQSASHARGISDVQSLADSVSSADDSSIVDAADYFQPNSRRSDSTGNHNGLPLRGQNNSGSSPPDAATFVGLQPPSSGTRRHSVPDHPRSASFESRSRIERKDTVRPAAAQVQPMPQSEHASRQSSYDQPQRSSGSPRSQSPPLSSHKHRHSASSSHSSPHSQSPQPRRGKSNDELNKRQSHSPPLPRPRPVQQLSGNSQRRASAHTPPQATGLEQMGAPVDLNRPHFAPSTQFFAGAQAGQPGSRRGSGANAAGPPPQMVAPHGSTPPPTISQHPQRVMPPQQQAPLMQQRPGQQLAQDSFRRTARRSIPQANFVNQRSGANPSNPASGDPQIWVAPGTGPMLPPPPAGQWQPPPPSALNTMPPPSGPPPSSLHAHGASPPHGLPPGVRFSDEAHGVSKGDRMRRRTMEEMARERERAELDYEAGRRRTRHPGTRRSRSGDDR